MAGDPNHLPIASPDVIENLHFGPASVFIATSWHEAEGAILTPDDRVVPMVEISNEVTAIEIKEEK